MIFLKLVRLGSSTLVIFGGRTSDERKKSYRPCRSSPLMRVHLFQQEAKEKDETINQDDSARANLAHDFFFSEE
jgi:hypothetical protein